MMKKNDGFVLFKSLLTIAIVLVCTAAFYAVLAATVRQSRYLGNRIEEDFSFRREKIMERIK
ncbi:MAG: hypothetical protein FWG29_03770 [Treponema sp.]|nr:hypothetical protein [Treponema sp.]